jgi:hypothetical protein
LHLESKVGLAAAPRIHPGEGHRRKGPGEHAAADGRLYEKLGLDAEVLGSGCGSRAGCYGYEAGDTYESSMRCDEESLQPSVREAGDNALLLADGFSNRHQIGHDTGRGPDTTGLGSTLRAIPTNT